MGVIPARGGSKGIPKKNIVKLRGKPLIYYTINAALESKNLDRFIVSTDDKEIARISKNNGAEVMMRPKYLARDDTPTIPVIRYVIKELEKSNYHPDFVMILQPTTPMRTSLDIDSSINMMIKSRANSLVSVCLTKEIPYWMYKIKKGRTKPLMKTKKAYRRQNLPLIYKKNGAISIARTPYLMKKDSIFDKDSIAFVMPPERSIDIDEPSDLNKAEMLMKKK